MTCEFRLRFFFFSVLLHTILADETVVLNTLRRTSGLGGQFLTNNGDSDVVLTNNGLVSSLDDVTLLGAGGGSILGADGGGLINIAGGAGSGGPAGLIRGGGGGIGGGIQGGSLLGDLGGGGVGGLLVGGGGGGVGMGGGSLLGGGGGGIVSGGKAVANGGATVVIVPSQGLGGGIVSGPKPVRVVNKGGGSSRYGPAVTYFVPKSRRHPSRVYPLRIGIRKRYPYRKRYYGHKGHFYG